MVETSGLQTKIVQEMLNFQKTMDELRFLNMVSKDLQRFKKMAQLRKHD